MLTIFFELFYFVSITFYFAFYLIFKTIIGILKMDIYKMSKIENRKYFPENKIKREI